MTGWMLVYIVIKSGVPYAVNAYGPGHTFDWMYECFVAREQLGADLWHKEGYFPDNMQAICVKVGPEL